MTAPHTRRHHHPRLRRRSRVLPLVAVLLALSQLLVEGCGCSSKAPSDRPLTPEKLRVYIPANVVGMARKTASKHDDTKDDFTVVYQDLQNNKGDMFHLTIRDYAEDAFGERFVSTEDPKFKKLTHRGQPARELLNHHGKPTVEMLIGKRYLVTVSGDEEKNRLIPVKALLNVLDAVDIASLLALKPPVPQAQSSAAASIGTPSGVVGGGVVGGAAAPSTPEPQPSWSPSPRPTGAPNWLTGRIELALTKIEEQETELAGEILRLEKQLRLAGRSGNATLSRTIATQKQKFEELNKRDAETRKDLDNAYKHPPPPTNPPTPTPTPVPTKPREPTLREKWTAAIKPLTGVKGQGQAVLDILLPLPLDEKKTVEWHVAVARAYADVLKQYDAADALLMLGILDPTPHPEVQPVQNFLRRRAGQSYILAMAAKKVNKPKDAVKAYMDAVRLDSKILLKEDQGLRETALKAMRTTVEKRPERTDLHFLLGVYSQAAGENGTAIKNFQDCVASEKDPYLRWRAEAWLKFLQR